MQEAREKAPGITLLNLLKRGGRQYLADFIYKNPHCVPWEKLPLSSKETLKRLSKETLETHAEFREGFEVTSVGRKSFYNAGFVISFTIQIPIFSPDWKIEPVQRVAKFHGESIILGNTNQSSGLSVVDAVASSLRQSAPWVDNFVRVTGYEEDQAACGRNVREVQERQVPPGPEIHMQLCVCKRGKG